MKKILMFSILLLVSIQLLAQNINTSIKEVTVYRKGALINRTGTFNITKGTTTFYIKNLSTELDPNTIRIGIKNKNVKIVSLKHEFSVEDDAKLAKEIKSEDNKISQLKDSIRYLNAQSTVLENERNLIFTNMQIGGTQNGVATEELISMSKFYKSELSEIAKKLLNNSSKIKIYKDEVLALIQEKSNKQSKLQKKISQVKLVLSSENDYSNVSLSMNYLVFDASWDPFYEVRIDGINLPLNLVYCAHVNQSSTEDWEKVKLTISTGDPSLGNTAPEFVSMFLPPVKRSANNYTWNRLKSNLIYGVVTDKSNEPLAGVAVVENGTQNETITDLDGKFSLEMTNTSNRLNFNYIGYESESLVPGENMQIVLQENESELEEVLVIGYGSKVSAIYSDDDYSYSSNKEPRELKYNIVEKALPLDIKKSQTATEFKIDIPYTIPSDGKNYDVTMLTYIVSSDYKFTSIPRYSNDVYLLANITDFAQFSLLDGNAYVYLENMYQGECEIKPNQVLDTLSISVGRDKDIAINRQEVKDLTSKKIIGSTIKVQKCFEITVKNNKNNPIDVEILDQYPLPKYTDIKVELTDKGGAQVDTETGKLTWKIHLNAQQKQTLRFSYEVKYPNSYNFNVE
ncbi:MAG: mucoidy inhibitor MuiA family protein [Bacteroidales bacterium]|nr:mucoidy inhibitor MuiA family protein [Bacteroidales bacterium]